MGSPALLEGIDDEGHISEKARNAVMNEMRATFRPEFLNRVDDVVLFKPLTLAEIGCIVDLQVTDLKQRLASQHIDLTLTTAARDLIASDGYDPVYGARPLKRFIQQELESPMARDLIAGKISDGATVKVGVKNGKLSF